VNTIIHRTVRCLDLGLIDYKEAWDYQTGLLHQILAVKAANRDRADRDCVPTPNFLIFCEHPHVFTLGRNGNADNLLIAPEKLPSLGASYYAINRGGDITYHGPGQLVVYPVIDLENFFTDIHKYMRFLEEAVIQALQAFGIAAGRINGLTGVWVHPENPGKAEKICALGVKTSRWATLHGLALNVNTDLSYFGYIVPCGISDKAVTSMKNQTGLEYSLNAVQEVLKEKIGSLFEMSWATLPLLQS
jgi:lipoyl(octanoyl) transferase